MKTSGLLLGLWVFFVLTLLSRVAASLAPADALATKPAPQPTQPAHSIIDFLSQDVQYSYFLRHLQRLGLVPRITQMRNVTLFAPVNSAFVDLDVALADTPASVLRYFAPQRFRTLYLGGNTTVFGSMYVTRDPPANHTHPLKVGPLQGSNENQPDHGPPLYVNDVAEIVDADGYAKHQRLFVHGIDRLLPQGYSMCDVLMSKHDSQINGHSVEAAKLLLQLVLVLQREVATGGGLGHTGSDKLVCEDYLAHVSTVLLPTDKALRASLLDLQWQYYLTLARAERNPDLQPARGATREMGLDVRDLLAAMLFPDLVAGVNGTGEPRVSLGKTWHTFAFKPALGRICVDGRMWSVAGSTALTFSDGVLHLFDAADEDTPRALEAAGEPKPPAHLFLSVLEVRPVKMIPRKALYAMHYSNWVEELKFWRKGALVGPHTHNKTIVIDASDRDDFYDDAGVFDSDDPRLSPQSFNNRQQLQYKFLDGAVDMPLELQALPHYHRLLDSSLCIRKRINSCFKVKVLGELANGNALATFNDKHKAVGPVLANGNAIYVVEPDFTLPLSFKSVLAELISEGLVLAPLTHIDIDKSSCLQTLKYLQKFDLLSLDDNYKGYTVFLPCGKPVWEGKEREYNRRYVSWNSLGLILTHLEKNPKVFKRVLRNLFLEDLVYSDFGLEDAAQLLKLVRTLAGESVNVSETYSEGDFNHIISVNETQVSIPLNSDILFSQGVVHITKNVLLPGNFRVTLRDLLALAEDSSGPRFSLFLDKFAEFAARLQLDGPDPPFSLLVPTPELLLLLNITLGFDRLEEFLQLHLITNEQAQAMILCMGVPFFRSSNHSLLIRTNHTAGLFRCHTNARDKTLLTLMDRLDSYESLWPVLARMAALAKGQQVQVVNYGCTQYHAGGSGCVFMLDRPLDVHWFDVPDNFLHVHIGWISVALGAVLGISLCGFCVTTTALFLSRKKPVPPPPPAFLPAGSSYMRVTSDGDHLPAVDYGYESDDDVERHERSRIFPVDAERRKNYGLTYGLQSPMGEPSRPVSIKGKGIFRALQRDRDLPTADL